MALQIIPRLPALDTQATLQAYQAVAGATAGMCWPKILPLATWKSRCPSLAATLPADDWGMLLSGDHSTSGTGRWYLETASTILGLTDAPTEVFTGTNQNEMPCCFLNPVHEVIEVMPHVNFNSEHGFSDGQVTRCYWTVDFATFNDATVELPGGGYLYDPPDIYFQATSLLPGRPYAPAHNGYAAHYEHNGKSYLRSVMVADENISYGVHIRDAFTDNWSFLGHQPFHHGQLTGDLTKYFFGNDCMVEVEGQWYRIALYGTRPRSTLTGSISIVAIPIAGPHDATPLEGYQTLVTPASGFHLIGSHDAYWDDTAKRLYITYTERETATGQNRIRIAYNATGLGSLYDAFPATYTAPATPIRANGRVVPEFTITTSYVHDDLSALPAWITRTGSGSETETADGFAMTSAGDVSWDVNVDIDVNSGADVVMAKWTTLRFSDAVNPNTWVGFRDDAGVTDGEIFLLDDSAGASGDRRLTNRLAKRANVNVEAEHAAYLWTTNQGGEQQFWHREGFDLTIVFWAAGRKFALLLDDQLVLYRTISASLGAVHPFLRLLQAGQTMSYKKFEFLAGTYIEESTNIGGGLTYSLTYPLAG